MKNYTLYFGAIKIRRCETDPSVFEQRFSLRQFRHAGRWFLDHPTIAALPNYIPVIRILRAGMILHQVPLVGLLRACEIVYCPGPVDRLPSVHSVFLCYTWFISIFQCLHTNWHLNKVLQSAWQNISISTSSDRAIVTRTMDISKIRDNLLNQAEYLIPQRRQKLTAGDKNYLYHYVYLDMVEGILLSSVPIQNTPKDNKILVNFNKYFAAVLACHKVVSRPTNRHPHPELNPSASYTSRRNDSLPGILSSHGNGFPSIRSVFLYPDVVHQHLPSSAYQLAPQQGLAVGVAKDLYQHFDRQILVTED
ncbi:hypothetical protein DBV15_04799 [Temnothorax longispinosus]|uniref:Uncharacterized protein n=1 Tax=Temnothorax longispinosus TaxID=300112 RepID=A0A4S2JPI3_9HYME|nr:hypothetical protein DBV15_04799 [Temnothorax longispinosus]